MMAVLGTDFLMGSLLTIFCTHGNCRQVTYLMGHPLQNSWKKEREPVVIKLYVTKEKQGHKVGKGF